MQTRVKAGKRAIFIIKKKRRGGFKQFLWTKLNVSSSHKSLHALTIEPPKGHPAHAEQLLQNLHQFNIPNMKLNLFPPLLQKGLWFCEPWSILQRHQ